jgi:hypothetical protein
MPYPGQFVRLVIIGKIYNDVFNTSLSIVPSALGELGMPAVDATTLAQVATNVSNWWTASGGASTFRPITSASLTGIKLNRIGPSGHYVDPISREHIYPSPIAGSTSDKIAAQLSIAATFRTRVPRGRGSHGRMYLPPSAGLALLGTDGRLTTTAANEVGTSVKSLIDQLNATYTLIGRVGVASDAGSGIFEHVTAVDVGRVPDTIRSRRSQLLEDYQRTVV